jgi:hypothetical protein
MNVLPRINPGDTVQLKGTDRTYTVIEISTHNEGTPYECQWSRLQPPPPATHTAHWPIEQLEAKTEEQDQWS